MNHSSAWGVGRKWNTEELCLVRERRKIILFSADQTKGHEQRDRTSGAGMIPLLVCTPGRAISTRAGGLLGLIQCWNGGISPNQASIVRRGTGDPAS